MDLRILSAAGTIVGVLAMTCPAVAQPPGARAAGVAARPSSVAAARSAPVNRTWHRPGRGFAGPGFAGGLVAGGLYGSGYGAGPANVDASVRTYPSPDELAPAAWSYGTYGIPTVPGITHPPKADPVVYVIDAPRRARPPARVLSRAGDDWVAVDPQPSAGGARVVNVTVPR